MILTIEQIAEIVKKNPAKTRLANAVEKKDKMRMHLFGIGMSSYLPKIEGFEAPGMQVLRTKYAKSNRDLFSRLSRPIDKVFSSSGGSVYYNLQETNEAKARALTSNVRSGMSVKEVLSDMWRYRMIDDPNGLLMMEIYPQKEAQRQKQMGNSVTYPTFKPVDTIFSYLTNGARVEYVFLNTSKSEKEFWKIDEGVSFYRVIDDAKDILVTVKDDVITIVDELPNLFGMVPAMLNSDLVDPSNEGSMASLFDDIIELADDFLLKGSIKMTHDFMHAYPKYWEYADTCSTCQGTRYVGSEPCKDCKGSGKSFLSKVSDVKLLEFPTKEDAVITPNVAGYVNPSEVYHKISSEATVLIESLMRFTLWGTQDNVKQDGTTDGTKTATQIVQDIKPEADRLTVISKMAEKRDKFIRDMVVKINIDSNYKGSSVTYGKRFMLEGPDVLWEKYQDAKAKGVAQSALDDMLLDYYEAKYISDQVKYYIQKKLMKVEPFVHVSVSQAKALGLSDEDYLQKLYFGEWLSTMQEAALISSDEQALREMLKAYCGEKKLAQQAEVQL
jgi:hypothetical protein